MRITDLLLVFTVAIEGVSCQEETIQTADKFVQLNIAKSQKYDQPLRKRSDIIDPVDVVRETAFYSVEVEIGTPPQK